MIRKVKIDYKARTFDAPPNEPLCQRCAMPSVDKQGNVTWTFPFAGEWYIGDTEAEATAELRRIQKEHPHE